jgi:hypothetical protein
MLVPVERHDEALAIAKTAAEAHVTGHPLTEGTDLGPVISQLQFDKIQRLIDIGIKEGATLVTGGLGRPENLNRGYYVRPTVFGHVTETMTVDRFCPSCPTKMMQTQSGLPMTPFMVWQPISSHKTCRMRALLPWKCGLEP